MPATRVDLCRISPVLLSKAKGAKGAQRQSVKNFQAIARDNYVEIREITEAPKKNSSKFVEAKASKKSYDTNCDWVFSLPAFGMSC